MNRKSFVLPVIVILFVMFLGLTRCGSPASRDVKQDSTPSNINAPAPDNNSASNPSTADTSFQRDSTKRKKVSVH